MSHRIYTIPLPPHTLPHIHTGGTYRSCSRIILDIVYKEGPRHLWKGLLPRLIAVPSMMSAFFVINEELERRILHTRHM